MQKLINGCGFASITKVGGTLGTYDGRNQITHKCASILHLVDIKDENTTHEEPKYPPCQQNMNALTFEVPKNPDIP
jgi:hypothetical protein